MNAAERTEKLLLEIVDSDSQAIWPVRYSSRDLQRHLETRGIFLEIEGIETTLLRLHNVGALRRRADLHGDLRYQITERGRKRLAYLQTFAISAAEVA